MSHFLNTLSLDDKFPPLPGMFDSYISRPVSPILVDDEDGDIWYPAEEGSDETWTQSPPPPASPVRVEDDTHSSGGTPTCYSPPYPNLKNPDTRQSCHATTPYMHMPRRSGRPEMTQTTSVHANDPVRNLGDEHNHSQNSSNIDYAQKHQNAKHKKSGKYPAPKKTPECQAGNHRTQETRNHWPIDMTKT
ncbi:hypothetical protein EDB92DRAFT_1812878 [Lactarius akahatsu]|uniref:Uncharacterized protein n=1 Tax=Lactarius akahatsu TaxID=416441 RepID=A0AAD4LPZ5_9AGAM|nr:hypothetical protein EDB92DRAFT_1812878 [Lactarius akahatsu]